MRTALNRLIGPPMAAPETRALRTLRLTILCASLTLAVLIALIGPARALMGAGAIGAAAGLLAALALLVPIYLRAKTRADDAHLMASCRGGER